MPLTMRAWSGPRRAGAVNWFRECGFELPLRGGIFKERNGGAKGKEEVRPLPFYPTVSWHGTLPSARFDVYFVHTDVDIVESFAREVS